MQKTLTLLDTTIGKKALMAVTGLVLYGFVIGHMLGNLQIFLGAERLNAYSHTLKTTAPLLWGTRFALIGSVIGHTYAAIALTSRSSDARQVGYRARQYGATSYAAITMKYGGPALLLFVLFHLAHFTFPGVAMGGYAHSATDVYRNLVNGFSVPWVAAIYVAAQVFLGLHLYHGSWSMLQTLGLSHPRYNELRRMIPPAIGLGVAAGNIAIPLSVLAGIVK
jgi:succinate dehydrogenase / fumarate reductase cytochrome b subunit